MRVSLPCSRTRPRQPRGRVRCTRISRRTRCGPGCSVSPWWRDRTCRSMATGTFTSAFASVIRSTRARLDLCFKKSFSFPHFSYTLFPCSSVFLMSALYTSSLSSQPLSLTSPLLSLSRCLSVTHLHLGSLGHGRGSSLDWARLPLTSPRALVAGLHCLHLHTQHALFIYLYLLASPLMILRCTCLVLSCHFFVNLSAFLSACLFVGQS